MSMTKTLSKRLLDYVSTSKERRIISGRLQHESNNKTAEAIGIPRRTVDRVVQRVIDRAAEHGDTEVVKLPKILIFDIETAPMTAYLWSLWQKGVNPQAIEHNQYILSWAAKWLNEKEVMYDALCFNEGYKAGDEDDRRMLKNIWDLMNEADFVVAHNGDNFDVKRLNARFLLAGFEPPNPYKSIDTLKIAKRTFGFASNSLAHLLEEVLGEEKGDSGGFDTWKGCMSGDLSAWEDLIEYNKDDVIKLERLYLRIRSWDRLHPSAATWGGVSSLPVCTVCGSEHVHPTGHSTSTGVSVFDVWACDDCGTKMRSRESTVPLEARKSILVKAK